jgi:hypothetical protein
MPLGKSWPSRDSDGAAAQICENKMFFSQKMLQTRLDAFIFVSRLHAFISGTRFVAFVVWTRLDATDVSSYIQMHLNALDFSTRSDASDVSSHFRMRLNAATIWTHPNASENALKHLTRLDAFMKRIQTRSAHAFGRVRCFILAASKRVFP